MSGELSSEFGKLCDQPGFLECWLGNSFVDSGFLWIQSEAFLDIGRPVAFFTDLLSDHLYSPRGVGPLGVDCD